MRCLVFLLIIPVIFASDNLKITQLQLKILKGTQNGAAYVSVHNSNNYRVTLKEVKVKVEPEVCDRVELHDHVYATDANGLKFMKMIAIPEMEIEPGATLILEPGSKHLMLMGIKPTLCNFKKLSFQFSFLSDNGNFEKEIEAEVPKSRCGDEG